MYSPSSLLNILFIIFSLQPLFILLQQHGIQQVNACLCSGPPALYKNLDTAEWATHIRVIGMEVSPDHQVRYTTKFLKIFKVPSAWPYAELENSTGTIWADNSCSVHLKPMSEYLLAGSGTEPINSISIYLCASYWTRSWSTVAANDTLKARLDTWAAQLAADQLKKPENADNY